MIGTCHTTPDNPQQPARHSAGVKARSYLAASMGGKGCPAQR